MQATKQKYFDLFKCLKLFLSSVVQKTLTRGDTMSQQTDTHTLKYTHSDMHTQLHILSNTRT